jgi:hypothetical protein
MKRLVFSTLSIALVCLALGCGDREEAASGSQRDTAAEDAVLLEESAVAAGKDDAFEEANAPVPFEVADQDGHLVSRGFRIRDGNGGYIQTGHWIYYFPSGRVASEGEFADGLKQGRWAYYVEADRWGNGWERAAVDRPVVQKRADYERGKEVWRVLYHPDGSKSYEGPPRKRKG